MAQETSIRQDQSLAAALEEVARAQPLAPAVAAAAASALPAPPALPGVSAAPPPPSDPPAPAEAIPAEVDAVPESGAPKRRTAAPPRARRAANDDAPSIGGLIYALQQKPSRRPMTVAGIASAAWLVLSLVMLGAVFGTELGSGQRMVDVLARPSTLAIAATVIIPIALFWFLAMLMMRAQELRQMSSAMTEVAVRLAEPDRMAEQHVASLGQSVRRQVNYMNEAVSRALGRAGELEALVHNEVSALERAYGENEQRIRGLIGELTGERQALEESSVRVSEALRGLGTEIPQIIDRLGEQQIRLAQLIEGAQHNLTALDTTIGSSVQSLESTFGDRAIQFQTALESGTRQIGTMLEAHTEAVRGTLAERTDQVQTVFADFADALTHALGERTNQIQVAFESHATLLDATLSDRTEGLQSVFEEYARALDSALANRQQSLDLQVMERARLLDEDFQARLTHFDDSIRRSTEAIDNSMSDRARALSTALEAHARQLSETLGRQANEFDDSLATGINAVRKTSENVTRQSLKAIEGLATQADTLRNVSENLLMQINSVTGRFETQGQAILKAANALETANLRIDNTLQSRQGDLMRTLDRLSGAAQEVGDRLAITTEARSKAALAEFERLKSEAGLTSDEAVEAMRAKFSSVSRELSDEIGSIGSRFSTTTHEMRERATQTLAEIEAEQQRLRRELERLPESARLSAEGMRQSLQEQIRAMEQLSTLAGREMHRRDIATPISPADAAAPAAHGPQPPPPRSRSLAAVTSSLASEFAPRTGAPPARPAGAAARDNWSLGDLLARASRDEEGGGAARPQAPLAQPAPEVQAIVEPVQAPGAPAGAMAAPAPDTGSADGPGSQINLYQIARALDPTTASAIWSRFRGGQRGIMVRSIYTMDGRSTFDDVTRRYKAEPEFRASVERYLVDFERLLVESEQKDPSGRTAQTYIVSDSGRVYLFLAHASGRLT